MGASLRSMCRAHSAARSGFGRLSSALGLLLALALALCVGLPAAAQESPGTAVGRLRGKVADAESGAAIENATVILELPDPGNGSGPREEIAATDPSGAYVFESVPAGRHALRFVKSGRPTVSLPEVEIVAGQETVQDFAMPAVGSVATEVVEEADGEIEEFVVEAALMDELLQGLSMRTESDVQLDLMSAEDLSKFAASDVADALKRVSGINIVEGQFAIIRGLEDRYSSTTFNGAPVPSPDPDSQSVQLDLFPSDVVSNLAVAKTFEPAAPSNSSGGSIDIVSLDYPEDPTLKLSLGTGFEEGAEKRFLEYDQGSTVGKEADPVDIIESDVGASAGGQHELFGVSFRVKGALNHEIDYRSEQGFQEGREPELPDPPFQPPGSPVTRSGGLAFGELALSDGRFDQIESTRTEQLTGFAALGVDLDEEARHRVDATYLHTEVKEEIVELRENGYFTDLDYGPLIEATQNGDLNTNFLIDSFRRVSTISGRLGQANATREELSDSPARGALWFANFGRSNSFERERDLDVYQLNGVHEFDVLEGLEVRWATNYATTTQDDSALGMRFIYEPCGTGGFSCPPGVTPAPIPTRFPVRVGDLGEGNFFATGQQGAIVSSRTNIEEEQYFARIDAEQEIELTEFAGLTARAGLWWEQSDRDVDAFFVENVTVGSASQWLLASPTLGNLGGTLFDRFDPITSDRSAQNESSREILAGHANLKLTLFEDLDLLGGARIEELFIDSKNQPFTGEFQLLRPATFPTAYLFFDRLDNPDPALGGEVRPGTDTSGVFFNDQILGINTPINPDTGFVDLLTEQQILALANGEVDENLVLPAAGLTYRPLEGLVLRASYSQTVARPSFREMGYYVTVQPGTDERTVGNPQLGISEVESYDGRVEYLWGELGDLVAFSSFYKVIDDPIESIILRNPLDRDSGSAALFRTFFNNPNTARLWGIELEARKSFDFLRQLGLDWPGIEVLDYLSVGGNFTYIDASVARSEAERARARDFFRVAPGDVGRFGGLERKRRLFGQPEWIGNADISFKNPESGTTLTLAVFAISDVLDAAGTATIGQDGVNPVSLTLDRYLDDFHQLDLIASQEIWEGLTVKMSIKNLTDSPRRRVYDTEQTSRTYVERTRRFGMDWSFSFGYTVDF